jgi:hypothetical protein
MKYAGLLLDDSPHYIDHLAPFCILMGWPLLVCNQEIAETCRKFYPQLNIAEVDVFLLKMPPCIVTCHPRPMIQAILGPFRPFRGKLLWLPHGLSDKGWKTPFFQALAGEDLLLVYGQKMRDMLQAKKVPIPQFSIGNFRYEFYLKNRPFYDSLRTKRSILYAPTWDDAEQNGTFWEAFPKLIEQIPNLTIKIHPNTQQKYASRLERLRGLAEFLDDFPPIYPLLNKTDLYIGDMSSIGYDFLPFQRPLFFLRKEKTDPETDPSAFLMQAGTQITVDEISTIENPQGKVDHSKLLAHAFDAPTNWTTNLQQQVDLWLSAL